MRTLSAILPEDPSGLAIGRLARRLLAEAEARPALIGRDRVPIAAELKAEPFAAMALLADPALDIRQYLEDLVSIAVNSARHAEDVSAQAKVACRKARRGMVVVASFGALGLVVGVAGFVASRSSNVRLSEVRDQISTLQDMQRQSQEQISGIAAQAAEPQREAAESSPQPVASAIVAEPTPPPVPTARRPVTQYYIPWPDSKPPPRRTPVTQGQAVAVPGLFADIQRNLRAIFH